MPPKASNDSIQCRPYYVGAALESVSSLVAVLSDLTETEIHHCIALEANSQRRKSILAPLVRRAARINKQRFLKELEKKHGITINLIDNQ